MDCECLLVARHMFPPIIIPDYGYHTHCASSRFSWNTLIYTIGSSLNSVDIVKKVEAQGVSSADDCDARMSDIHEKSSDCVIKSKYTALYDIYDSLELILISAHIKK